MAKDIKVRLYSNSRQFNSEMSSISRQMRVVKSEFEANRTSVQNWGNQIKQSEARIKYLNQSIDLQKRRVSELRKAHSDSAQAKGKDAKETQSLATRLNRATAELNKMQGQLKTANAELKRFGQQQSSKKLEQDLKSLSNEAKRIDNQFKLAQSSSKNFGNEMRQTSLEAERLKQQMTVQSNVIKRLEQEYKKVWSEKRKNTAEARNLANAIDQERIKLNGLQNSLTQTTAKMKQMNAQSKLSAASVNQFGDRMNHTGMEMRRMGMGVGIVAGTAFATLTAGLTSAYGATANFEQGMSKVQAVSGSSAKEMKLLDKQARELGASTRFTATQASEGMEKLALAGWKANEIMAGMPGMLNLAAAGNLDLATAADITSDTMAAFGLEAKNAGHSADVFAYAQANANTNVEQMGEAMKYAAPVANALGWTLEETAAAQMALADSGLKGSIAGQAFATSLARLAKPTDDMVAEMDRLNMKFFDAQGNMKPLPKVMAEIEKGTKGMTREQRSATLTTLFGAEAYKHWAILLERGSDKLAKTTEELKNADGAAEKMAKTMMNNAAGKVIEFQSAIEGLQISLTRHLMPAFSEIVETATGWVRSFTDLDESTQKTIVSTAAFATAALGVTTVVAGLTAAVGAFLTFAGPVGLAIAGGTAALGALGVALYAATTHTENLMKEQEKAKEEAVRYGDGLSAGTKKGVKGYVDLYEGAKLKMHQLKNMSGEEAQKTSAEIVNAFSKMADQVIAELETQKEKLTRTINDVYSIAGDAGKEAAQKLTDEVLARFDEDIANYKKALDIVKKAHDEYNNDLSKMPADFAKAYQEALTVLEGGSREFAKSQEEIQAIQKNMAESQGKILFQEAEKYTKSVNKAYNESLRNANKFYADKKEILDQSLAQGRITQQDYNNLIIGLEARTYDMYAKANTEYEKALGILSQNLDSRGKLIDIATGKEFRAMRQAEIDRHGFIVREAETREEYVQSWMEHTQNVLKNTANFSKKTKEIYQKDLQAFLESTGMTKQEAVILSKQMTEEALAELGKGEEKARSAGEKNIWAFAEGLKSKKPKEIAKQMGLDLKSEMEIDLGPQGKVTSAAFAQGLSEGTYGLDAIYNYFQGSLKEGMKFDLSDEGKKNIETLKLGMQAGAIDAREAARTIGLDIENNVMVDLGKAGKHNVESLISGLESGKISIETFTKGIELILKEGAKVDLTAEGRQTGETVAAGLDQSKPSVETSGRNLGTSFGTGLNSTLGYNENVSEVINKATLNKLGSGESIMFSSGNNLGLSFGTGLNSTFPYNQNVSNVINQAALNQLGQGNVEAGKHGKNKGDAHKQGLDSTKGANKTAADGVAKASDDGLKQGKNEAGKHGSDKGTKHKQGLDSTRGANLGSAGILGRLVSSVLGKTTDGGGGQRAGMMFSLGLRGRTGAASSAGSGVAKSGERGLRSINTSGAGIGFVSGFVGAISSGRGSVWKTAWNLGQSALSALKKSIDSRSPSKRTALEGINYVDGFAVAIEKQSKKAVKSAVEMAKATHKAFTGEIDNSAFIIDAAAKEIRANKDKFVIQHKVESDSLKVELTNLKSEMGSMVELFKQMLHMQSRQLALAEQGQQPVFKISGREIARATYKETKKLIDFDENRFR
ncbi:phage tail tape measure protein [Siminovitchia sp. FSL W7-1587]|uniref:phage tail tape measure protein n=1 Tax=Siminovitchia sp. FSL W7-1587 TaxID=2954699 RepID=UPI0030CAD57D